MEEPLNLCRLCLCKIEKLQKPEQNLIDAIQTIFGFDISGNEKFPQIICNYCKSRVLSFIEYFNMVLENQEKLVYLMEEGDQEEEDKLIVAKEEPIDVLVDEPFAKDEEEVEVIVLMKEKTKPSQNMEDNDTIEKQEKRSWNYDRINSYMTFKCELCSLKKISGYLEWKDHMRKSHDMNKPKFECCNITLDTERKILVHINTFHDPSTKEKNFTCNSCLKQFRYKREIERHLKSHTRKDTPTKRYKCKKCSEQFTKIPQWQNHQRTHDATLTLDAIPFPCNHCEMEFDSIKLLHRHVRIQHKKKFLCDICAKACHHRKDLKDHVQRFHSINPPQYKCHFCALELATKQSLRNHIKILHTNIGTYPCPKCDKIANTEGQLQIHIKQIHDMGRKFKCAYCEKAFRVNKDLEDHESIHTGISRHECPKCQRKFNSKSNMQSHAKKCTAEILFVT